MHNAMHASWVHQWSQRFCSRFASLLVAGCMLVGLPTALHAAPTTEWEPTGEFGSGRDAVRTWARAVEGMQVKAFKGVTEVPVSVPVVLALFSDINNGDKWIFNCRRAERLTGASADKAYLQFKGVWPASDRDVVASRQVSQLPNGDILYETRNADGLPEQEGYVRIRSLRSSFRLTPMPGEWTKIEFETQVDVGGLIPAWIANVVSLKAPRVTLEGIRRQVMAPQYQSKKLSDLPAVFLKDGAAIKLPNGHLKDK